MSSTIALGCQRISRNGGQARGFVGVTHIEERFAQRALSWAGPAFRHMRDKGAEARPLGL